MKTSHIAAVIILVIFILPSFFFPFGCASGNSNSLNSVEKWFILLSYDPAQTEIIPAVISNFKLAILDPDSHPQLEILKNKMVLIAYISLGEAATYRSYWQSIQNKKCLVKKNPNWGSYYVDVRDTFWQKIILEEVVPKIVALGFQGLMLDTLDTAEMLELDSPEKYSGEKKAMVQLVKSIHEKYPQLLLISNNGFSILEEIAPYLSGMLVEDIHSMIDFKNNSYKEVPLAEREYKLKVLKKIQAQFNLPVFAIDYIAQDKKELAKQYSRQLRELGFKPYIAQKNLDRIYEN